MKTEFLSPTDPRWSNALESLEHDVYHTPQYVAHAARHEGGTATCFMAELPAARLLIPLLIRPLPPNLAAPADWLDAASPYGYPGPLLTPRTDSETAAALFQGFLQASIQRGLVTAFVRFHPCFHLADPSVVGRGQLVHHGDTVLVDLKLPSDALAAQVRYGHRYEIRRLARDGYRVTMNDWDRYAQFIELFKETMRRVGASDRYRFSDRYFHELRSSLGPRLHIGCALSPDGKLASASLFTEECGLVQYHLSATAGEFLRKSPAKILLDHVRDWAKDRGNRLLHLGGGLGAGDDSLFRFKAGFSKLRASFYTLRYLVDREKCELLARRSRSTGSEVQPPADYFPTYRRAA